MFCLLRQIHQLAAPQGFHDDHGNSLLCCRLKSRPSGLGVLVQIVILNLTEVPVISVQNLEEHFRIPVVGEADISDSPFFFLPGNPLLNPQILEPHPFRVIREHVHQVVVNMIGAQTGKFFTEGFVNGCGGAKEILGELGGNIHLVPAVVFLQNPTQAFLISRVNIGGVKVVDAFFNGKQDFFLCFFIIDAAAFPGESHTAIPQLGNGIAVSVRSVFHTKSPFG